MISCTFENGNKTSLRHVTVNAIVIHDGKVLMGFRSPVEGRYILEAGKWALLGGFFDRDETLAQAAKREVMEESGWEIANLTLLRINDKPDRPHEDRQNVDMVFFAHAVKDTSKHDREMSKLQWFDLNDLPNQNQIAFDHFEDLQLYQKYVANPFPLPVLG